MGDVDGEALAVGSGLELGELAGEGAGVALAEGAGFAGGVTSGCDLGWRLPEPDSPLELDSPLAG